MFILYYLVVLISILFFLLLLVIRNLFETDSTTPTPVYSPKAPADEKLKNISQYISTLTTLDYDELPEVKAVESIKKLTWATSDANCDDLHRASLLLKSNSVNQSQIYIDQCLYKPTVLETMYKLPEYLTEMLSIVSYADVWVANTLDSTRFQIMMYVTDRNDFQTIWRSCCLVHKDRFQMTNPRNFIGKNACFPYIESEAGYYGALEMFHRWNLTSFNFTMSIRENELQLISRIFQFACLPGKWHRNGLRDTYLKKKYASLCALCANPSKCDYWDKYAGNSGAIQCLVNGEGDIAFTTEQSIMEFTSATQNSYERFVIVSSSFKMGNLSESGTHHWFTKFGYVAVAPRASPMLQSMNGIETTHFRYLNKYRNFDWYRKFFHLRHGEYLTHTRMDSEDFIKDRPKLFVELIESQFDRRQTIKLCVETPDEFEQCETLRLAGQSRLLKPRLLCVRVRTKLECIANRTDSVAILGASDARKAVLTLQRFHVVLQQRYKTTETFAVAVVRRHSTYRSLSSLRDARSCHSSYASEAGFQAPVYALLTRQLIRRPICPVPAFGYSLTEFFTNGSCVPGGLSGEQHLVNTHGGTYPVPFRAGALCSQCRDSCADDDMATRYSGDGGAFRCLANGRGDVAFLRTGTVEAHTDGRSRLLWTSGLKSHDYVLICAKGGRAELNAVDTCNIMNIPRGVVITNFRTSKAMRDNIQQYFLTAADLFSAMSPIYRLFGDFVNTKGTRIRNALFEDDVIGVDHVMYTNEELDDYIDQYIDMKEELLKCREKDEREKQFQSSILQRPKYRLDILYGSQIRITKDEEKPVKTDIC